MRFSLLGPLVVTDTDGGRIAVAGPRLRVLLATLLLHANVPVSADQLAEMVWDGSPPPAAVVTLRSYVKRLRRAVDSGAERIAVSAPGYIIRVEQSELDILEFEALSRDARAALRSAEYADASAAATRALGLWRAAPLLDVSSEALRNEFVPRLERLRLQVLTDNFDAGLRLGCHQELVPQLQEVTAQYPLQERFHGQLMLALAGTGQRAEALDVYQQARRFLVDQLGVEPGQELSDIHRQILAGDGQPSGAPVTTSNGAPVEIRPRPVIPMELPAPVGHFAGRVKEIAELTALLERSAGQVPGALVISAIGGTAGVGKTALAVHWAHQVAGRFPDGQLYMNLRGYDPDQPMTASDALARFLRALGVAGEDIPADEEERAAWYRTRLAGKRVLIVLDNAISASQVRPLLPGAPSCVVVVTSRDVLGGLVARDGATRLDLELLPLDDSISLLRALTDERVDADPEAAALLAERCSRLPLALRVAAELVGTRGDVSLARLVDELADRQQRLSLLDTNDDPHTAIRAVFSWSCRQLDARAARAFGLVGLHPGVDFGPYSVAALTGATLKESRGVLDLLTRMHLIQRASPDRYGMHDLLRAYARELTGEQDEGEQRVALTRLFDHYLHCAAAAMDALYPGERHRRPSISPATTPIPSVDEPTTARAWLDAERVNLVAITAHAARHGWPVHATRLATVLFRYLASASYSQEAITIYTHAREAASQTGDHAAEAAALTHTAGVYWQQSQYQQAGDYLHQALALSRQAGDRGREAGVLSSLGVICSSQCRYQEASTFIAQALEIYRQVGDLSGESHCLVNLGNAEERQGRYQEAADHHQQSVAIARRLDDRMTECAALINLGGVRMRQGELDQAIIHLSQGLDFCLEVNDRYRQADALTRIGGVRLRQGDPQEACDRIQEGLALYQEISDRSGEADALNGLGEALLAAGQPGHALVRHAAACDIAGDIGDSYQQARAYDGLALAHHELAELVEAQENWGKALALYAQLGTPEATQVRARLADAATPGRTGP
jgi:DNA-binding SARP family transcriptional activator